MVKVIADWEHSGSGRGMINNLVDDGDDNEGIQLKQEFMNSSMATTESHFSESNLHMCYIYGILRIHMTYCILYVNNYTMTVSVKDRMPQVLLQ